MNDRPTSVLIVGATGSVGRYAVAEALRQGYRVRALVRDGARGRRLGDDVELVLGDLTRPDTLTAAVDGVDGVVFVHGTTTRESDVRDVDYAGVANILKALGGRRVRIALMTAIGTTRPGVPYAEWKLRGERLVRASGNPYTVVRPGWFDYNDDGQRRIVMLQGDTRQSGTPRDGVIARDEIARVLIDSLSSQAADRKTFELVAETGPEQRDLTGVFAALETDAAGSLDGATDAAVLPLDREPETFLRDLDAIGTR
ncbi:SDR family oxidoreductase [Leifsonia sp. AG29]|uniref:SDR family oxidoreductase n=1 Tax=Leifsonia sp. AG29 TaxID=2598860 RepID=UPI00131DFDEB|nr:SDR family oxidoreductase [Leifsonia sp. AG29]